MNSNLSKILTIISGIIGIIAIFFLVRIVMEGDDAVKESVELQNSIISPYVSFAKIILIITAVLAVVYSLVNLLKNPKQLKKSLISVVVLGVLLALAYGLASDAAVTNAAGNVIKDGEAGSISKWVSTGIWYSVILGGIGLAGFLLDFVRSLISK